KNASLIKEKEANSLKQDPVFQRALERLERLSSDPKTRKAYEASINEHRDHLAVLSSERKAGHVEGLKKGRQEGRQERDREIALKMLKRGRSIDEIVEDTGLSIEEIKNLQT
ncbi:MAG: hypothetical protein AB7S94_05140, partial [Simkaniaceae bacterium]